MGGGIRSCVIGLWGSWSDGLILPDFVLVWLGWDGCIWLEWRNWKPGVLSLNYGLYEYVLLFLLYIVYLIL